MRPANKELISILTRVELARHLKQHPAFETMRCCPANIRVINRSDSRLNCHLRLLSNRSQEIRNGEISCSVYSV